MTTADWAILISLVSLGISLAGFIWNVWSKFIYPKPRVRVSFRVMEEISASGRRGPSRVFLSGTNHGPGEVTLYLAVGVYKRNWYRFWKRPNQALLSLGDGSPFGGELPKKIAIGDDHTVTFPTSIDWFDEHEVGRVGFIDTFGRYHWCSKKQVEKVRDRLKELSLEDAETNTSPLP